MVVKHSFTRKATFTLLFLVLFIYGIIQARNFLYPIVFALLIAYLLFPIVNFLEKHKFPRILAILISLLITIAVIVGIVFFFYQRLNYMLDDFADLKIKAQANIKALQENLEAYLGIKDEKIGEFLTSQVNDFFGNGYGTFGKFFTATTGTLVNILLLPVYIFLFLFYRTKFAYFIMKTVNRKNRQTVVNILRDISTVAARYMGGVTIVVLILCVLNSVGLLIVGVKYAVLFGIISALFNFIPYFGTLAGGTVPLLFVLLTSNDPAYYGIRVAIFYIIIQFTENNILTPNIVGYNVKINPFFIIVGLVFGALVWGIPGMLVIVPFLAIMRIIFSNIEQTKSYAFLLGPEGTSKHGIPFSKIRKAFIYRKKERDPLKNR